MKKIKTSQIKVKNRGINCNGLKINFDRLEIISHFLEDLKDRRQCFCMLF